MNNQTQTKPRHDVFCPICNHSIGVYGERTETFSQYVAYCKHCRQEFVLNYFKVTGYDDPLSTKTCVQVTLH